MADLFFYSMASGSSGNSYYVGNGQYGFLIDAGISARTICRNLKQVGLDITQVRALFVTHIHKDHTKSMSSFSGRWQIPVYTTRKVHDMIDKAGYISRKVAPVNRRFIEHEERIQLGDFSITSFYVPHDAEDNSGFLIEYKGVKLVFATDIGHPTPQLKQVIQCCDYLVIESNHDEKMLKEGHYPEALKERVLSDFGHLSNRVAAEIVAENAGESLKHVFLCHLSKDNNTPELARQTMMQALQNRVPVVPLKRCEPELFKLG